MSSAPIYSITKEHATPRTDCPFTLRVNVWKDTQNRALMYPFEKSTKVTMDPEADLPRIFTNTFIEITPEDTIIAGKRLSDAGLRPVLLNFADDLFAGGCVDGGCAAQEESLWRRTNLCATQVQSFYPLAENPPSGIYTPLATIFKDTEENRCVDLVEPWSASFMAVHGLKYPHVNTLKRVSAEDEKKMRDKIRLIFQIARKYNHDALVLGALGCGAWRSPPAHIAEIFKAVCKEYNGVFRQITFAIFHSPHSRVGESSNYSIFKSVFEN